MADLSFAVTFDYRCPFARNAHEHVVAALQDGADWDVQFLPFSLSQTKVPDGDVDVWDEPTKDSGIIALQAGVALRELQPDRFLDAHLALFSLRHDRGGDLRSEDEVRDALSGVGIDPGPVFVEISSGAPLETIRKEHEAAVTNHRVFGVPTFIAGDEAVFVRVMSRSGDDPAESRRTVERVVGDLLVGWTDLNEFKRTTIAR